MLRTYRVLSIVFFVGLMLANCEQLKAGTYELGPFQVIGVGSTPQEAEGDAYGQASDIIMNLYSMLPPGDDMIEFVIEHEGLLLPTAYVFEFHVVVRESLEEEEEQEEFE